MTETVLITGAAKRIGRAIALELAQAGYDVAIHYNSSKADAAALAEEISALGRRTAMIQADLEDEGAVEAMLPKAIEALGPITALVNNASLFERDEALDVTRAGWDRHMMVNLRAPFVLMQQFARSLPADRHGAVVNLIDERVWNLTPHFVTYTLSKSGLWALTQTMALALAPRIRLNAVGPGPVLASQHQTEDQFRRQWRALPLERQVMPEHIAGAVKFLLEAPTVTGQMIAVDSGEHLAWAQPKREFTAQD
jgi:NAD(P)-dependent dehydrogenase (short-subunit alcohol dehydrogenase family)